MVWPLGEIEAFLDQRGGRPSIYGACVIDIDYLIRFCLRFGDDEIACILENIHAYLRECLPAHAGLWQARHDEFLVLCPGMARSELALLVLELKKGFKRQKFARKSSGDYANVTMTFSAGVASFPYDGNTPSQVIRKATVALFVAKSKRRDRVCEAPNPHLKGMDRVLLSPDLIVETVIGQYGEIGYLSDHTDCASGRLWEPQAIGTDGDGTLYIVDQDNHCVLECNGRTIAAVAGCGQYGYSGDRGPGREARLNKPTGMALRDRSLYITDTGNDAVRKLDLQTHLIETVVGTGQPGYSGDGGAAVLAQLNKPGGAAADQAGNLYINDIANNVIRKVDRGGMITTYAGTGEYGYTGDGGPATKATFAEVYGICGGSRPGDLYLADYFNHCIRMVDGTTGTIHTVAGTGTSGYDGDGGDPLRAHLNRPVAIHLDRYGNLFIAESGNSCVRVLWAGTHHLYTVIGDGVCGIGETGPVETFRLANPNGIATNGNNQLYVLDGANNRVCRMDLTGVVAPQTRTFDHRR